MPTITSLINNFWSATDLREAWFTGNPDFCAVNAHFTHWEAIPGNLDPNDHFEPSDIATGLEPQSSFVYSVGCHAGLNMPNGQSYTPYNQDFVETLAEKGISYIANTGYGYGDYEAVGYSELLSILFLRNVKQGLTIGDALAKAKGDYYQRTAVHSFSPYDEKVLSQVVLYGLPMQKLRLPPAIRNARLLDTPPSPCTVSPSAEFAGMETQMVHCVPSTLTETMTILSISDMEMEVNMGQPVQPRLSVNVSLSDTIAHGVVFEGGIYNVAENFDPAVTQVITDTLSLESSEPEFDFPIWVPSTWDVMNSVRTQTGVDQNLVIIPAQYRATTPITGVERIFEELTYTVYYSDKKDGLPPMVWKVEARHQENEKIAFKVETTDFSGVARVVVAYTNGTGEWQTFDLEEADFDNNLWGGTIPESADIDFFVQVLDTAGNVSVVDNKGLYFQPLGRYKVYLPLVVRQW